MKSSVDKVIDRHNKMVDTILRKFCQKQGFNVVEFSDVYIDEVIVFDGEYLMSFENVLLDVGSKIKKGFAISYMNGFSVDDGFIDKELSYKEYLKIKKLI